MTPQKRALQYAANAQQVWDTIYSGKINLRREILSIICLDTNPTSGVSLKHGLPGLYLLSLAKNNDQTAYDLLGELGFQLDFDRPKAPGGVSANAARDFTIYFYSTLLLIEFPFLYFGANDATPAAISAVDLMREEIEKLGLGCVDYKTIHISLSNTRTIEKAIRRFTENPKNRELFWP